MLIPSKHSGYQAGIRLYPGKSKAPPPPDYTSAAIATSQGNLAAAGQNAKANQALARETAAANLNLAKIGTVANRANQYNPYGSLTWEKGATDYDPWTQRVNLTPEGQRLLDNQNQLDQSYSDAAIKGFAATKGVFENPNIDQSLLPKAPIDAGTTAQQAMMSRLQPTLERNEEMLRTRLANQGIGLGSQAYGREMNLQGQQANDMYLQSMAQGINMDAAARERALNEAYTAQSRPLDLINSLRSGSQVTNPVFASYANQATTAGPDIMGAYNSAVQQGQFDRNFDAQQQQFQQGLQQNQQNAKRASRDALIGGLFSLGGAAMMSDRRLKTNIKPVGKTDGGLTVYTYNYIWGGPTQMGVMAQDVEKQDPSAVVEIDGFKAVDYSKVQ
jgi:hypothetical protein